MNSLAFFMVSQGSARKPFKIVFLAGLINLPYYLAIIATTVYLSEEVMQVAENTPLLFSLITTWLAIAIYLDIKRHRIGAPVEQKQDQSPASSVVVD
jgi:membrane-associated protein